MLTQMTNFPLYDRLNSELSQTDLKDLTVKQKEQCVEKLKHLDQNGQELVYMLIRSSSEDSSLVPFGGQMWKTDMRFNFNDFPVRLKHLINKFLDLHTAVKRESTERSF